MTSIALAVFDMAGTTVDEHGDVYRALEGCVVEAGATVSPEDLQTWMGTDKVEAITALLGLGGVEATDELVARCFDRFRTILEESYAAHAPEPLTGVEDAFRALQAAGVKVALTTGFSTDVAAPLLTGLGWQVRAAGAGAEVAESVGLDDEAAESARGEGAIVLDAVVCASEVAAGRPKPYMIHRAMERTGIARVDEVLVAGDTVVDVEAGLASSAAESIGVLTGALAESDFAGTGATAVLAGVSEVPAHLGL